MESYSLYSIEGGACKKADGTDVPSDKIQSEKSEFNAFTYNNDPSLVINTVELCQQACDGEGLCKGFEMVKDTDPASSTYGQAKCRIFNTYNDGTAGSTPLRSPTPSRLYGSEGKICKHRTIIGSNVSAPDCVNSI